MFGFLKNIWRKPAAPPADNQEPPAEMAYESPSAPPPAATPTPRAMPNRQNGGRGTPGYPAAPGFQPGGYQQQNGGPQRQAPQGHPNGSGKGVEVPLHKILEVLPMELQPRVRNPHVGDATISIPLEKVLSQLSRGAVRLSFGELRQAAPGVFSSETDRDRVLVQLPLNEVLTQLNPALIARRRVQKQVEVPDDISSPFESQNQSNLSFSTSSMKAPKAPTPPPAPANPFQANPYQPPQNPYQPPHQPFQPPHQQFQPPQNPYQPPQNPYQPPHQPFQPAQNPFQPGSTPFEDIPNPFQPARPIPPSPMGVPAGRNTITSTPKPQPPAAEPLISPSIGGGRGLRDFEHKVPNTIGSAPFAPAPEQPSSSQETIAVSLAAVAESWPEAVRKELVQLNVAEAKVHLPVDTIQQGLRQGKLAFPWKTVRSWIKAPGLAFTSPQDGTTLDLPLKVVAPLFMARQGSRGQQKVKVDNDIPNLFFGFPQADSQASPDALAAPHTPVAPQAPIAPRAPAAPHLPAAPHAPIAPHIPAAPQAPIAPRAPAAPQMPAFPAPAMAKTKDTNYYTWDDPSQSVQGPHQNEVKRSPGTKFITRYATPNEVVSRAAGLEGVAGSLIALPDGLMVASQLSPDLNGDTLAAFLPQIFAKVNQCTKELRMGELNNLNFTVGNVPWKIFRVNAIFFAAFGRAGEPLPTGQLAALAAELDHKGK
jgi:predicted regulator of Ras-like GTPase activity (Roadblock/LC7/MglB family)